MSERFFVESIGSNDTVELGGEEAHHLSRVRRIRRGELVQIFDGSGIEATATVCSIGKESVSLTIQKRCQVNRELPFHLTLGCSPAKGERLRWLVEKATELGVTRFVPIITERSSEQARSVRPEKMMRWVIEGSKQSGRNVLMELCDATSWTGFLQTFSTAPMRLVADRTGVPLDSVLQQATASNVVLAVGPEGGFTTAELITAEERAWRLVNLGRRILRVETAAIAIVSRIAGDN